MYCKAFGFSRRMRNRWKFGSGSQISQQQNGTARSTGRLPVRRGVVLKAWHWVDSKIYVYNVTFGLYMLDWWERCLFNLLVLLLLWFVAYSSSDFAIRCFEWSAKAFRDWPAARRMPIIVNGAG
ncbi:hypothetical protein Mapa_016170 [Marchantia paleacea]|nr:hypothetical protein Mapa_016170 [Marchantia paleacea]